jgi:uncharacterized Rmd1/YagE family protein
MAAAASERAPLLPRHQLSSPPSTVRSPTTRPPRNVTFNPLTTVSTREGVPAPGPSLRPIQPASNGLSTSHNGPNSQPMLSAINSKLRRRNSAGAPLSPGTSLPTAPKIGAQRTTKNAQKLKLLPNPEEGDEGPDEESGRDVYSQFTRIKDPTARRDAARLGKADRDRLPRVTAYCTAQAYRLEGVMRFMKSRARTGGANPKLFDECLYSPYNYEYLKKDGRRSNNAGQSTRSFPERLQQITSPPRASERRYSDSAVEMEDSTKHRREDLIDMTDQLEQDTSAMDDTALTSQSTPNLHHRETSDLHIRDNSDLSTTVHTPEIFIFDYGAVVIWGMTLAQERRFLTDMSKFADTPLPAESAQTEDFNFYYTKDYQARIYNDFISLRDPKNHMIKLAISHALAQSVKTSLFEDLVSDTIEDTSPLPALIAQTGSINLTRRQLNMKIGELFILRINIHLQGSVLDSPELMWAEPHLEPVYAAVRSYLEIGQRVELLTERLDVIADLLAVLREQGSRRHGEVLEWIGMFFLGLCCSILQLSRFTGWLCVCV